MGCIYRRKAKQPDGTVKERPTWWIKYFRDGRAYFESARTTKKKEAENLLKRREGDIARGVPISSSVGRMRFQASGFCKKTTSDAASLSESNSTPSGHTCRPTSEGWSQSRMSRAGVFAARSCR